MSNEAKSRLGTTLPPQPAPRPAVTAGARGAVEARRKQPNKHDELRPVINSRPPAGASEGFSGPEIEQVIVAGLYTAFNAKQQWTTEILLLEIQGARPLSVTRAEEVQSIREWAKTRAVPVD